MEYPHSEKYNILMHYNQFAETVRGRNSNLPNSQRKFPPTVAGVGIDSAPIHWQDNSEWAGINEFEKCCETLRKEGNQKHTMIELGGGYAYYSMLFAKFFESKGVESIIVEPYEKYHKIGIHHFKINGLKGHFLDRQIYNPAGWCRMHFNSPHTSVDALVAEFKIRDLDILHMDIDSSEAIALKGAEKSLSKHLINFVYVATHSGCLHSECKHLLLDHRYKQVYECTITRGVGSIGGDGLLLFKRDR